MLRVIRIRKGRPGRAQPDLPGRGFYPGNIRQSRNATLVQYGDSYSNHYLTQDATATGKGMRTLHNMLHRTQTQKEHMRGRTSVRFPTHGPGSRFHSTSTWCTLTRPTYQHTLQLMSSALGDGKCLPHFGPHAIKYPTNGNRP